jgi:hypothetical protein
MISDHRLHVERNKGLMLGEVGKEPDEPDGDHSGMIYNPYSDKWSFL